jgi:hypothetical protein
MKILIAYFSGTGNTYYCAEYLKERLEKDGHGVSLRAMERLAKAEVPGYDILIAGFPVFVFDMPELVKDFFTGLPSRFTGRPIFSVPKVLRRDRPEDGGPGFEGQRLRGGGRRRRDHARVGRAGHAQGGFLLRQKAVRRGF